MSAKDWFDANPDKDPEEITPEWVAERRKELEDMSPEEAQALLARMKADLGLDEPTLREMRDLLKATQLAVAASVDPEVGMFTPAGDESVHPFLELQWADISKLVGEDKKSNFCVTMLMGMEVGYQYAQLEREG